MAKKICITVDDDVYEKLNEVARKNFGAGKLSVSRYLHLILARNVNRQWNTEHPQKTRNEKGCVYVIQEKGKGYIKIGFGKDFENRMESIKTNNPHEIKVLAVVNGCIMQDELNLHEKYRDFCIRGEWYKEAILNHLFDDIESLKTRSKERHSIPTSSEHYLYLVEA